MTELLYSSNSLNILDLPVLADDKSQLPTFIVEDTFAKRIRV